MKQSKAAEMPKAYCHQDVEERLYDSWLRRGYFTPRIRPEKRPFTIVIPPPNVTGELHHGHAMFVAFQDLMVRWRRMQGYPTLWLPGTDHAGIATQNVVEAELAKEGLTRHHLGREKFVERVWQRKETYGGIISTQLRRLGASCDWTRERFTLDEGLSRAVREAFVRLYNKGLIYRGEYMINWCPRCATALSDLEVEHQETPGQLWYVRYPLADGEGYVTVATTRPETMLGDTAVAVHPDDERFAHLVGRWVTLPIVGRVIPIISDTAVERSFGTGAVKVTPAHDPADYEIGLRAGLPAVNVMNPDTTMNEKAGQYAGLSLEECRQALLRDLQAQGFLVKAESHIHSVGHCDRCGTVVEPRISLQWFVRIKPLAQPAIAAVKEGKVRFIPERFSKIYFNWMANIRDWCISRQLWWGHRIPVWYCDDCGTPVAAVETPTACSQCGHDALTQDPDVLDTWFSSALWPFSTLGWPEDTEDLRYFYPTSVMETGYDIIFFWVARMIMMGLEFTGQVPFHDVYLHGLMRDEKGEKMSKSKGNAANPLDVTAQYGADALRFTIVTGSSPGNDMKLVDEKLEASRNFANKLWNAARFVRSVVPDDGGLGPDQHPSPPDLDNLTLADRWILSRCRRVVADVTQLMEQYQFGEAGRTISDFFWGEYCDWYIEIAKIRLYGNCDPKAKATAQQVLLHVLDTSLRLLHPFMPFVTEDVWQHLARSDASLMVSVWPQAGTPDPAAEKDMEAIMAIVRALRNIKAEFGIELTRRVEAAVVAYDRHGLVAAQQELITALAWVEPLRILSSRAESPKQAVHALAGGTEIYVPLAGIMDIQAEKERVEREIAELRQMMERTEKLLAKADFLAKAPPAVVDKERDKLADFQSRLVRLNQRRAVLSS